MKTKRIYPLRLLMFICLLSSCSIINQGSGYDASPVFALHHEKAGEVKASAGYGGMLGVQGNISYALTHRLAVMAGGVYNHQNTRSIKVGIFSTQNYKLKSHYFEGALGYYLPTSIYPLRVSYSQVLKYLPV